MITIQQLNRITPCDVKLKGLKQLYRCKHVSLESNLINLGDNGLNNFLSIKSIHLKTFVDITKEDLHDLNLLRDGLTGYQIKEFELYFDDIELSKEVSFHEHKTSQDGSMQKILRYTDGTKHWFGLESLQDKQLNPKQVMWLIDNNFDYFNLMEQQNGKNK